MPGPPAAQPIGMRLARTARVVSAAFDRAMAQAGGSAVAWQVLLLVRSGQWGTQSQLARAMGVTEATLTHHMKTLERQGLVSRRREGRVQRVELTPVGVELFDRMREVAQAHDARLRSALTDAEAEQLGELLGRLEAAASPS